MAKGKRRHDWGMVASVLINLVSCQVDQKTAKKLKVEHFLPDDLRREMQDQRGGQGTLTKERLHAYKSLFRVEQHGKKS